MALRSLCSSLLPGTLRTPLCGHAWWSHLEPAGAGTSFRLDFQQKRGKPRFNQPRPAWIRPDIFPKVEENLTEENGDFLQKVVKETYVCPLREPPPERAPFTFYTKRCGVICRKLGLQAQWLKTGERVTATLLQVVDNHVISNSPSSQFGTTARAAWYKAGERKLGTVVVGAESIDPTGLTDDYVKLFEPSGIQPKRKLSKFIVSDHALVQPGTQLRATHFRVGDYVDIGGRTIDRAYQGVMKRWGFKGGPTDKHGATKFHRRPGSIGFSVLFAPCGKSQMVTCRRTDSFGVFPRQHAGRVMKGKKMAGHMGNAYRVMRGVQILRMNTKHDVIYVRGNSVPGLPNSFCLLMDTVIKTKRPIKNPPPMPTHYPEDDANPLPEEVFHPDLHQFGEPSIVFQVTEEDLKKARTGAKTALKSGKTAKAPAKTAAKK